MYKRIAVILSVITLLALLGQAVVAGGLHEKTIEDQLARVGLTVVDDVPPGVTPLRLDSVEAFEDLLAKTSTSAHVVRDRGLGIAYGASCPMAW
jgi:hypothetical protein